MQRITRFATCFIVGVFFTFFVKDVVSQNIPDLNCYMIGSPKMPVRYIKGTGSNVGLYIGIEYDATGKTVTEHGGFMGAVHSRIRGGFRDGGGGQGGGKLVSPAYRQKQLEADYIRLEKRHQKNKLIVSSFQALLPQAYPIQPNTPTEHFIYGEENFQLLPITRFAIDPGLGVQEILLPILCQDIHLPVPTTTPDYNFTTFNLETPVPETYLGIYRFDQYIEDHITPHTWIRNDFLAGPATLSQEEFKMLSYCEIFADSTKTTLIDGKTYYAITHAHLNPSLANYPVWVPNENQSLADCEAGIEDIWFQNGSSTAGLASFKQSIFELNHYVFHFAKLDSFKTRFPAPALDQGMPPVPDLRPYSLIKFSPIHADAQNCVNGVEFLGQYSIDADGDSLNYLWEFGDGKTSTLTNPIHQYLQLGTHKVYLTVTDMVGNTGLDSVVVDIGKVSIEDLVEQFKVNVFPNPSFGEVSVEFALEKKERVSLEIFNSIGQKIAIPVDYQIFSPGSHQVRWNPFASNADNVSSGMYSFRIRIGEVTGSKQIFLTPNN